MKLDRMALDDVGANPVRIAAAIHRQLGEVSGPIPVFEIAAALDIIAIREEPLSNLEGALLTRPERDYGTILVNKNSSRQRRRFTVGHELMHFLSPLHEQTLADVFMCSRGDMTEGQVDAADRHRRQEAEANAFSIELLAPLPRIKPLLRGAPNLKSVLSISSDLDISKEAAARRYVTCHDETLAVVFSKNGKVLYFDRSKDFPRLALTAGATLPDRSESGEDAQLGPIEATPPAEWFERPNGTELTTQTLLQQNGHAITLLHVALADEDDGLEDTFSRFTSNRR